MLTSTDLIRIVLVDDHLMLVDSLVSRFHRDTDIEVVGTATNADDGLSLILETEPDVVILDVELPGRGSFDIAEEISSRLKNTKMIFLTGYLSDIFIELALRVNAVGYLLKGEPIESLIHAIKKAARGEYCFSQSVQERLIYDQKKNRYSIQSQSMLTSLTSRQIEVLRHLARGKSVKEVARSMHLSEKSIDSHKYRIMHKLGIHDRVELARYSIREGLTLP
ncbi:Transcriptional regulatory protein LiaR [Gimesia panareensis]|uniref:Transcriptional regulatory protein LiaR n=1 Tax=Gimesia panareensis TaxID=2527978 RepID=A0A518FHH7_9PLAN|nr:response regulator transcription factor [Gimesia panareensis]QDV15805.1 Transcriptional regulatory protein LiaR [Gimesia panareensis]